MAPTATPGTLVLTAALAIRASVNVVPSDLPQILAIIAMLQRFSNAQNVKGFFSKAAGMATQEVADLKNPIATGISHVGSSQCDNVKNLARLNYEQQRKDGKEPDVNNLTLNFISPDVRVTYYLRSVASELPQARNIDANSTLVLFMHGFTDNPEKNNFQLINNAYQSIGRHCILALDASPLLGYLYLHSTTYVRFIGEKLGDVLAALHDSAGISPKSIHLIGHSLGAHISSFAAKRFQNRTGLKVARLTGLDPAGPCFSEVDTKLRINITDAEFVDAIHTNGGVYGMTDPVGHADYYPNGGTQQPECFFESCSHSRAVALFAESITNPEGFLAVKCNDFDEFKDQNCSSEISPMGLAAAPGTKGKFYLQTNTMEPYALGRKGIVYADRDGISKSILTALQG